MSRTLSGTLITLGLLLGACAPSAMKVPAAAEATPQWPLTGYKEGSFREPDMTLDGRTLRVTQRTSLQSGSNHRNMDTVAARRYRFELSGQGATLAGECNEVTQPRKLWLVRYGNGDVHLTCSCVEGTTTRASISLIQGAGTLRLGDGSSYEVKPVHDTSSGKHEKETLGYTVAGGRGAGALERTGKGRLWPVPGLVEPQRSELACAYAALLLYRERI